MYMSSWITSISLGNFELSCSRGLSVVGYTKRTLNLCRKIELGDKVIFYILGIHKFGAIAKVTSSLYTDDTPYWPNDVWPYRFAIKPEIILPREKMIDISYFLPFLSFITQRMKQSGNWGMALRQNPKQILQRDSDVLELEMKKLQRG